MLYVLYTAFLQQINLKKENVIKKNHREDTIHLGYVLKTSMYEWTLRIQTHVGQGPTVNKLEHRQGI